MKVKRHKHVRRVITFYTNNFGYTSPYNVLIDGTFCRAALKFKVNIMEQLPKYLNSEVRIVTTNCIKAECESLGPLLYGPLKVLQQFDTVPCGHHDAIAANRCMERLARHPKEKKKKYFIATQDVELSDKIRRKPGVPLVFISHNAINLESPSDVSRQVASGALHDKLVPSTNQKTILDSIKKEVLGETVVQKKRKKGPKGPNPLSCKKRKTKAAGTARSSGQTEVKRRKRKRKKTQGHVVEPQKS